ncbi:MAG: hypothetical protein ACI9XR_001147 [Flavobacterium sp.]|jgi:hypothetical protein
MKSYAIFLLIILSFLTISCFGPSENFVGPKYEPVYMTRTAFENSISIIAAKPTITAGKIYIKDDFLYVNDVNKGFQIYNYSNPTNPLAIGYINFPGATDMAIRNNAIHVNQATDLVSVEIFPITKVVGVTNRIKNAFPIKSSPDGFLPPSKQNQVVVNWKLK